MSSLPEIALSVRQPWAWAIIHAAKDIENRSAKSVSFMVPLIGRRAIHAAKGMTRDEYDDAAEFMRSLGVVCPPPHELRRGGIIGCVEVTGVVREHQSAWFFGPRGLVLAGARPCEFIPAVGALGYFKWKPADESIVPPLARWMTPAASIEKAAKAHVIAPDLFAARAETAPHPDPLPASAGRGSASTEP